MIRGDFGYFNRRIVMETAQDIYYCFIIDISEFYEYTA